VTGARYGLTRRHVLQRAGLAGLGLLVGCGRLPGQSLLQSPAAPPRVGYLSQGLAGTPAAALVFDAFRHGLQDQGFADGRNIVIESRLAEGRTDRLQELAADLVKLPVNVILAQGNPSISAARRVTNTVPIVMGVSSNPVGNGFAASLARPGGNVTGVTGFAAELEGKRLELLKECLPRLARVAVFWDASLGAVVPTWDADAKALGMEVEIMVVKGPDEWEQAFELATSTGVDGVNVVTSPLATFQASEIAARALARRLPIISARREFAEDGGLLAYGPNLTALSRRSAYFVARILQGTSPTELPIEQPTTFDLVINLRTAHALGLTIPQHVLLQATEVIR
jgi:putative tryptophan/tyrosine transport system substrate-binding protein